MCVCVTWFAAYIARLHIHRLMIHLLQVARSGLSFVVVARHRVVCSCCEGDDEDGLGVGGAARAAPDRGGPVGPAATPSLGASAPASTGPFGSGGASSGSLAGPGMTGRASGSGDSGGHTCSRSVICMFFGMVVVWGRRRGHGRCGVVV